MRRALAGRLSGSSVAIRSHYKTQAHEHIRLTQRSSVSLPFLCNSIIKGFQRSDHISSCNTVWMVHATDRCKYMESRQPKLLLDRYLAVLLTFFHTYLYLISFYADGLYFLRQDYNETPVVEFGDLDAQRYSLCQTVMNFSDLIL